MTARRKPSRAGRRRWAELVKFLTFQMKNAASEKVRMAAAMRLADVLELREQKELAELRARERAAAREAAVKAGIKVEAEQPEPESELPDEDARVKAVFEKLLGKGTNAYAA